MPDEQNTRPDPNSEAGLELVRRALGLPSNDEGQPSLTGKSESATDEPGSEGSDENDNEDVAFEDEMDVESNTLTTAAFNRAAAEHDDDDLSPQRSEVWSYSDPDLAKYGRF